MKRYGQFDSRPVADRAELLEEAERWERRAREADEMAEREAPHDAESAERWRARAGLYRGIVRSINREVQGL